MDWQEIRRTLMPLKYPFPQAAVKEVLTRWGELGPHFIAEIERVADGGAVLDEPEANGWHGLFAFATYLVAEQRDTAAYGPLVRACHCPEYRAHERFGDDVGTQMGRMLASVCDGDLAPLKALAEDQDVDLWSRYAALRALAVRVVEGDAERDGVVSYVGELCVREAAVLERRLASEEPDDEEFLTWACEVLGELGPHDWMQHIRDWLQRGLIDPLFSGLEWFEEKAAMSVRQCLGNAAKDRHLSYIRDTVAEMSKWACYDPPFGKADTHRAKIVSYGAAPAAPVQVAAKVGRNDRCPCGSGKKFKKCCDKARAAEPVAEDKVETINRAMNWLTSFHSKALKSALEVEMYGELDAAGKALFDRLDDAVWKCAQVNAMEWLMAQGSITVKGQPRKVAELLLGTGGPAFSAGQRRWFEQLFSQALRVYEMTELFPGVGMELRDVLDVDAPPKTVQDTVVGKRLEKGYLLGARCLSIGEHLELSGAVYIFPYWTTQALLADLRNVPALTPDLAPIIRRHWLAQFVATDEFEDD